MTILITGSSGRLGRALVKDCQTRGESVRALDLTPGPFTSATGTITDPVFVREQMKGVDVVFHAATLHAPHMATHSRQDFVDVNITGTLTLLNAAVEAGVKAFIFISSTSTFGEALTREHTRANRITEETVPVSKNIYGVTKLAAEDLCRLTRLKDGLPVIILKTSRFFTPGPNEAPSPEGLSPDNVVMNEYLNRRVAVEDIVSACRLAGDRAGAIGFDRYIISATAPFKPEDDRALMADAPTVVADYFDYQPTYDRLGWRMTATLDRVYVNDKARRELGWQPQHDFGSQLRTLQEQFADEQARFHPPRKRPF